VVWNASGLLFKFLEFLLFKTYFFSLFAIFSFNFSHVFDIIQILVVNLVLEEVMLLRQLYLGDNAFRGEIEFVKIGIIHPMEIQGL